MTKKENANVNSLQTVDKELCLYGMVPYHKTQHRRFYVDISSSSRIQDRLQTQGKRSEVYLYAQLA